jgi:maltooligosyltrehalose trehalohydrolase
MKRRHSMPFGAECADDHVRFRLWAPGAKRVALCLDGNGELPMADAGSGFFELRTRAARAGTRYGFRIEDNEITVPDPASRSNPDDVHGSSEVVDPVDFDWQDTEWSGRPWTEAVIYEAHVGSFTEQGNFDAMGERLTYLVDLGVTALELMPVAEFAGGRGWGYDGVLAFAPESRYGGPAALKRLVQAAHAHGLMVILDVVYNHFGPDGNYLHLYAPQFFTDRVATPWGPAIDFEGSRPVRDFFVHNALYWLEEYHMDGLRIDAVHAIHDPSEPDILEEVSARIRASFESQRHVHLILENDDNASRYLCGAAESAGYDAQWNDDFHHAAHVLLTGETHGYFADYADDPVGRLGRCLAEGFAFQGEHSPYRGRARGEPSADLPTGAFVNFLQNHDQIGNRALGERLAELAPPGALEATSTLLLLAPQPPLLFMGEEFAASSRFPYFCEFPPELAAAVAEGRRREFSRFPAFSDAATRKRIPDPNALETFEGAILRWREADDPTHAAVLSRYRHLLTLRHKWLTPRLPGRNGRALRVGKAALETRWELSGGGQWALLANLSAAPVGAGLPTGRCVYHTDGITAGRGEALQLPAWGVAAFFDA